MLEKEADEYFETVCLHSYADTEEQLKEDVVPAFKKGAEFGYNKANEWHYVKDKLPISDKDKYYFVVVDKWNGPMIARFYEGVWSNYSTIEDVIAWKEIVLPKEIKENDL